MERISTYYVDLTIIDNRLKNCNIMEIPKGSV